MTQQGGRVWAVQPGPVRGRLPWRRCIGDDRAIGAAFGLLLDILGRCDRGEPSGDAARVAVRVVDLHGVVQERVVPAGVQNGDLHVAGLVHQVADAGGVDQMGLEVFRFGETGICWDQIVLSIQLDRVPGIVEHGHVGTDQLAPKGLQDGVEVLARRVQMGLHLEAQTPQRLGHPPRVIGRVGQGRHALIGADPDHQGDALLVLLKGRAKGLGLGRWRPDDRQQNQYTCPAHPGVSPGSADIPTAAQGR